MEVIVAAPTPAAPSSAALPRPRRLQRLTVLGLTALGLAVLGLAGKLLIPPAPATNRMASPPPASVGTLVDERLPTIPLLDAAGRPTSLAAFRGKTVVLTDFMTSCQEQCPITTGALEQLRSEVNRAGLANHVAIIDVSIDPQRDTPARLRAYSARTGVELTLLTGRPQALSSLWKFLGIYIHRVPASSPPTTDWLTGRPYTYDLQHQDGVFFFGPDGREKFVVAGPANVGGALTPRLAGLLGPIGRQNLQLPPPEAWTVPQLADVLHWLTNVQLRG